MKKDIPKTDYAELVRDFRIDEEEGMERDPRLESVSQRKDQINLADRVANANNNHVLAFLNNKENQRGAQRQLGQLQNSIEMEKDSNKIVSMIDKEYPAQDEARKWMIGILKPFLLTLSNEPKCDYTTLIEKLNQKGIDRDQVANASYAYDPTEQQNRITYISKENLSRKFEARLKQMISCFTNMPEVKTMPESVKQYLRSLISAPNINDLTLME